MALRADDEKTACGANLFGFVCDLIFVELQTLSKKLSRVRDDLVLGLGVAGGFGNDLVRKAVLFQVVLGEVFGVSAEHDIGTTTGHVGGDRDRAELAGLRDDFRFLFVILGVQDVVRNALFL